MVPFFGTRVLTKNHQRSFHWSAKRLISVDTVHLGSALMCAAIGVGSGIGPDSIWHGESRPFAPWQQDLWTSCFFLNLLCCISATPSRFTWFTITYIPIPSLHLSRWIRHAFGRPWCEKSARLVVDSRGDWSGLSRDLRTWRAHITGISTSQARIAPGAHCHWGNLTVFIGIGAGRGPWIKSYQPFLSAFFSTPSTNMTTWKMAQSKYIEMLDLPSFQMVISHDFPAISLVHQRPSNSPNTFFVCCVEAHDTLLVVLGRGSSV